jgi:hypothetical protein
LGVSEELSIELGRCAANWKMSVHGSTTPGNVFWSKKVPEYSAPIRV